MFRFFELEPNVRSQASNLFGHHLANSSEKALREFPKSHAWVLEIGIGTLVRFWAANSSAMISGIFFAEMSGRVREEVVDRFEDRALTAEPLQGNPVFARSIGYT